MTNFLDEMDLPSPTECIICVVVTELTTRTHRKAKQDPRVFITVSSKVTQKAFLKQHFVHSH